MALATRDRARILRVGASWACFAAATALFYLLVIPQEIAETAHGGDVSKRVVVRSAGSEGLCSQRRLGVRHIPFFLAAGVAFGWLLWRAVEEKHWKDALLALAAIALAAPPVYIQSLHLRYHYLLFFPAAFLIALWAIRSVPDAGRRSRLWFAMAGMTLAGWLFFSIIDVEQDAYLWLWIKAARHQNVALKTSIGGFI